MSAVPTFLLPAPLATTSLTSRLAGGKNNTCPPPRGACIPHAHRTHRTARMCDADGAQPAQPSAHQQQSEQSVMQGPSQAPTKAGVSTVGLSEREAKFIEACYNADVQHIEKLLDEDFVASVTDVNGRSALHFCAGNGLPTLCTQLMDRGATIDKQDVLGFTPLHMATGYVKLDTVKLLVDRGADANIASFDGKLAVEIAEDMFEKTPAKQFFRANPMYEKLKEMVQVLDEATEVEDEHVEDDEDDEGREHGVRTSVNEFGEITEETENAKFVVRVKPRGEGSSANGAGTGAAKVDDVKVTIKIKEPEKKA